MSVGMDNWSEDTGQGRPLGTERPGPYGVGGPPVSLGSISDQQVQTLAATETATGSGSSQVATDSDKPVAVATDSDKPVAVAATTATPDVGTADVPAQTSSTAATTTKKPRLATRSPIGSSAPNRPPTRPAHHAKVQSALDGLTSVSRPKSGTAPAATPATSQDGA
jgi:hypothetical protein